MVQSTLLGVVLAVGAVGLANPAAASGNNPRVPMVDAKFTAGEANGEQTLKVETRDFMLFKRVGRDHVVLSIQVPGDRFELEARLNGQVRLVRNRTELSLEMMKDVAASVARVQRLTTGSRAIQGLEQLVASLQADDRPELHSLKTSYALLHAIRGNNVPARILSGLRPPAPLATRLRTIATRAETGPYACWAEYANTVNQYLVQFNDCLGQYWWIPGWTAACSAQFSLQGELAFFWLISCSGGMPV